MPAQLTGLNDATFGENTVNETPQLIDAAISYGSTGGFAGATLVVSGLLAEDIVSIQTSGLISYDSGTGTVRFNGLAIGTATGGVGGDFTVTFNANASYSGIDQLIEHLTYANTSDTPTLTRTLTINVTNGDGDLTGVRYTDLSGGANPFDGLATGSRTAPTFGDLDGDGDLDAVVGNYEGALSYYENTGTAASPAFALQTGGNNPFNGVDLGFASSPELADLDGDGDLDLIVGDQDGLTHYYQNAGGTFTEQTGGANPFDGIDVGARSAPELGDLDGDGDLDMVVGTMTGGFRYFENTGSASEAAFAERTGAANPFDAWSAASNGRIRLLDFDGDGDLDAGLLGLGSMIYLRNDGTASAPAFAEVYGTASALNNTQAFDFWGVDFVNLDGDSDVEIVGGALSGALHYVDIKPYGAPTVTITVNAEDEPPGALIDLAASVTFAENTVNAAPQWLDTDVTFQDFGAGFNGGTLIVSGLLAEDVVSLQSGGLFLYDSGTGVVSYDGEVVGMASGGVGASLTVTFNADATQAAVEAVVEHLTYGNMSDAPTGQRTLWIEIEDETGDGTGYRVQSGGDSPFTGITGARMSPELADMDADGDLDLVVGLSSGAIRYFENTGTTSTAVYVERTAGDNPFAGVMVGAGVASPDLADLDGDGDLDLVVGDYAGGVSYFENVGGAAAASYVQRTGAANPFAAVDADFTGSPALADLDGDGDLDLAFGSAAGNVRYFENTGTTAAAAYTERTGAANPFAAIAAGGPTAPVFGDFDGDGDLDLVVGDWDGTLRYFENTGTTTAPVYVAAAANPLAGIVGGSMLAAPEAADVDGDGKLDIVFGVLGGSLSYIRNNANAVTVRVTAETDVFTGTAGGETLSGSAGADIIDGGAGDDTLEGGAGADRLKGGIGDDHMVGGTGDDFYIVDDAGDTADETGGDGVDHVWSRVSWTLGAGFENLTLSAPALAADGTGNALANLITGNDSANTLRGLDGDDSLYGNGSHDQLEGGDGGDDLDGGNGNDTLLGGAGADDLVGGAGNDRLDGGTGDDAMTGGAGHDVYVVDSLLDVLTELAAGGTDTVEASISWTLATDFENLALTGTADIDGTGNSVRNMITGNDGDNLLAGGGEVDTLNGGAGDDELRGEEGNDVLDGAAADDVLVGGVGSDRLTGGTGADTFAFSDQDLIAVAIEKDQILDLAFADGDVIDLSGIDANVSLGGDQAFVWAVKFTKVAGQAVLTLASGVTTLALDVDGDGRSDFNIAITGDHTGTTGNLYTAGGGDIDGGWVL